MAKSKKDLLQEIKSLQAQINKLESESASLTEEQGKALDKLQEKIVRRAREIKKINQEQLRNKQIVVDGISEQERGIKSIGGALTPIKKLEQERVKSLRESGTQHKGNIAALGRMQSINEQIAGLSADDVIQRESLQMAFDKELASLDRRGKGIDEQIGMMTQSNTLANQYSNLTEKQRERLEQQHAVMKGIQDSVAGVLDTFSTLTSGPMGFLGTALIGAGFAMDKLGHSAHELGTFMTESTVSATALSFVFKDAVGMASALAGELGGVEEATFGTQLKANLLAHNLNLSSEQAAGLMGSFARLNGGSADMAADMMATTKEFAKQQGVIPAKVAGMLANNTEAFALFGKEGGKNMIEAAAAASKMGVEMSSLTGMADNLLDIENSLNKELELGAMLGKNINFDKARQLAFEGDLVGAQKEMLKQVGGRAAIENMNYYQLKETAAAMGISVGELQKMAQNSDKVAESQGALSKGFDYMSEGFKFLATGPLGTFTKGLGSAAIAAGQMGFDVKGMIGSTAKVAKNFISMIPGVGKISSGMGSLTDKLSSTKLGKGMASFKEKLMSGVGDKSSKITKDAQGRLRDAKGRFTKAPKGGGNDLTGKGSLVDSFNKIDMTKVLKGAAALVIVAGAVFVFGKAVQEFMKVSWSAVGMAVVSMLALVGSIALLGAIMSSGVGAVAILAGAAAMVIVASSMYILGKALQEIGKGFGAIGQLGETLGMIVPMTAGIASLAGSIALLSGSLVGLGLAGIAALPGLMALSMVGGITTMVGGLFGGGEEGSGDDSMEALLTEIQGLRADLNAGKVAVYLDGAKVTSGIRNVVNGAKVNSYGL